MDIMQKIFLFVLVLCQGGMLWASEEPRSLNSALREKSPYYIIQDGGKISGLDADIAALVFLGTGLGPSRYDSKGVTWDEALKQIEKGEKDFVGNATKIPSRERWAYFSIPYRDEEHVILMNKSREGSFEKASEFIGYATKNKLKIGILKGVKYNSIEINKFIKMPAPEGVSFIGADSFDDVIDALIEGRVDVAIVEHVNAIYTLNEKQKADDYKIVRIGAIAPQSFMFSKKTIKPELVAIVNEKIKSSSDAIAKLSHEYISPVVSSSSNWLLPEGVKTLLKVKPKKEEVEKDSDEKEDKKGNGEDE